MQNLKNTHTLTIQLEFKTSNSIFKLKNSPLLSLIHSYVCSFIRYNLNACMYVSFTIKTGFYCIFIIILYMCLCMFLSPFCFISVVFCFVCLNKYLCLILFLNFVFKTFNFFFVFAC